MYIISQIFITIALVAQGCTYFVKRRPVQLFIMIMSNLSSAICFLILGGYVAVAMAMIAIARDLTSEYLYSHRNFNDAEKTTYTDRWLLLLWISLLTIGNAITAHGVLSMLPYFSTTIFTIAIWQKNLLFYRFAGVITNSLLIVYNVFLHNVMGVILQLALLLFALCGFMVEWLKLYESRKHFVNQ